MNKIALWKNVCLDDWTAKLAIIASNVVFSLFCTGFIYLDES